MSKALKSILIVVAIIIVLAILLAIMTLPQAHSELPDS
jgi:hypothetical protein